MFAWCTEVLHLSEAEAYLRIAAARASREHPVLLTMLADGRLHLTGIAKLAPHLTPENRDDLLAAGRPPDEAPDRGARGRGSASPRCAGDDPEAPGAPDGHCAAPALRFDSAGAAAASSEPRPDGAAMARSHGSGPRLTPGRDAPPQLRLDGVVGTGSPGDRPGPSPPPATRSSSPPAPSSATSWSDCGRSCAPRYPTATWPRSSTRPSPRSSSGSKPAASPRRSRPAKGPRRARRRPPRATSRPRSGGPSTSAMAGAAGTSTRRAAGAPRATGSSSTTVTRSGMAATTP